MREPPPRMSSRGTAWRTWNGPAPDRPLLLLHGGAGSWAHWIRNVEALNESFTLWIPDLPGFGESADPPAPLGHATVAEALTADLDELAPAGVVFDVVGFSFGGIVGACLAASRPERVRALVLVGAGGLGLRTGQAPLVKPWRHLDSPQEIAAVHRYNLGALMLSAPARVDDAAVERYGIDIRRARVNSAKSSRADPLKSMLASRCFAVHGIWGRHDATALGRFDDIAAMLRASNPAATLRVIEDAGHWVQYEKPDEFHAALREALGRG